MNIFDLLRNRAPNEKLSYSEIGPAAKMGRDQLEKLVPADHGTMWSVGALKAYFSESVVTDGVQRQADRRSLSQGEMTARDYINL